MYELRDIVSSCEQTIMAMVARQQDTKMSMRNLVLAQKFKLHRLEEQLVDYFAYVRLNELQSQEMFGQLPHRVLVDILSARVRFLEATEVRHYNDVTCVLVMASQIKRQHHCFSIICSDQSKH